MKLIVAEPESERLRSELSGRVLATSVVGAIELHRAALRSRPEAPPLDRVRALLREIDLVLLSEHVRTAAETARPQSLRTLDAVHLASALSLGTAVETVATYDHRLAEAVSAAGLRVLAPA